MKCIILDIPVTKVHKVSNKQLVCLQNINIASISLSVCYPHEFSPQPTRGTERTVTFRFLGFRTSSQPPHTAPGVTTVRVRRRRSQVNLEDLAAHSWGLRPGRFSLNLLSAWQSPAPTESSARSPERRDREGKLKKKEEGERETESEVSEVTEAGSEGETAGHKRGVFCSPHILPRQPQLL